jgi:CheY-like chemotaxis protein
MARICVNEPNPETRDLLALLVTRLGHDVVERDADVVLVEPVEDGPGAVGLARRANPRARIVVCSIALHDRDELGALRADGFLLKPFGLAELRAAIAEAQAPAHAAGGS